ncbi:hypothetical protein AC578_6159 [Pseudocercospora eumusae]|uniref:FAD-binding domain-containing protein n=1 Tax=Pseudocercospora eumusae TaxID=321146 RepID=A0A139H994_9PEZI|nr:hypothetical protein AC578_6159 [Pseudocercospora eumusae]
MTSTSDAKIIIIGAGATGLALAQGLKKSCIAFDAYERAPSPASKRNWCFGIHWGFDALKHLVPDHFLDTLDAARVDPHIDSQDESLYRLPLYDAAGVTEVP